VGAWVKSESPPHRSTDTTWESNLGTFRATHHYAAIPDAVHVLCGMADVVLRRCATRSRLTSTPHPSKRDNGALEECIPTYPAPIQDGAVTQGERSTTSLSPPTLCDHLQPCAPSPALWSPVLMEHRHTGPYAAQAPPLASPSNWRTDCDQARVLGKLPSRPLPGEYRAASTSA
jgi:hypothetical protein